MYYRYIIETVLFNLSPRLINMIKVHNCEATGAQTATLATIADQSIATTAPNLYQCIHLHSQYKFSKFKLHYQK